MPILLNLTGFAVAVLAMAPLVGPAQAKDANWDKTFPQSITVSHEKISFKNKLGINVSADMYMPKDLDKSEKHAAIIVGPPYGGIKEQTAGFYAQAMAERGYITIAFDPSYYGESSGEPRGKSTPEAFVEDFSAAVDYVGINPLVDRERIGVIGICGSGGFAMAATEIDPRIKALATVSMYDIGQAMRQGLSETLDKSAMDKMLDNIAAQRWTEAEGGKPAYPVGVVDKVTAETGPVEKEFYDYYRTPRGQHPRGTNAFMLSSFAPYMLFSAFEHANWISPRPVLFIAGENAHSLSFSKQAFSKAAEPKELYTVPNAGHVDLYDKMDLIPWTKLESFFGDSLK